MSVVLIILEEKVRVFFSFCGELRRRENENETGFQNFMIIEERGQQRPTSMSCNSRARYPCINGRKEKVEELGRKRKNLDE